MMVTPVDLGIEDSRKFRMFIAINNFDGTRRRWFAAWEQIRKMQFKQEGAVKIEDVNY
jgi:hypothetical protein